MTKKDNFTSPRIFELQPEISLTKSAKIQSEVIDVRSTQSGKKSLMFASHRVEVKSKYKFSKDCHMSATCKTSLGCLSRLE